MQKKYRIVNINKLLYQWYLSQTDGIEYLPTPGDISWSLVKSCLPP